MKIILRGRKVSINLFFWGGRLSEKYLIDNQLRGPDSSSTLEKADETNLK